MLGWRDVQYQLPFPINLIASPGQMSRRSRVVGFVGQGRLQNDCSARLIVIRQVSERPAWIRSWDVGPDPAQCSHD